MIRIFRGLLFTSFLFLAVATLASASGRRDARDVAPNQLQEEVSGREVTVMLKDGRYFQGQIGEVTSEAMRVKVTRSKLAKDFPAGTEQEVKFADLGTVSYVKHQGKAQWLFPTIVGGVGGLIFLSAVSYCNNEAGINCPSMKAWSGGVAAGATAAAVYGGQRMSRVEVQLRVRPPSE